ncbi:EAL domain-containing protein [Persephonella atlantica]|uniref:Diguanylate cyclase DosC n=1 Tax=Persephonella atlantica TaxID=2699429 RepID=A0ABS1GK92_9AQUI|nr:EAL domain-containing protein [Persephonella atlantica]MBK3333340.1 EAL domain-containing protein [Persephonella atlantica]
MLSYEILEPYMEDIFNRFYEEVLSDEFLKTFFDSDEQIKSLVKKQIQNFKETLKESDREIELRYYNLGQLHYRKKIPFVNLVSGVDFIKNEIYRILIEKNLIDVYFFDVHELFEKIKNVLARTYLELSFSEIYVGINPEYKEYPFFNHHYNWLLKLKRVIKSRDKNKIPELDSKNCQLGKWLRSKEFELMCGDNKKCMIINDIHELIHNTAKSLVFYVFQERYVEAYLLFKTLSGLSLKILNELYEIYLSYVNNREERFLYFLSSELKRIKSGSITIINVKRLKAINEIYGKETGDFILEKIEQLIKKNFLKKNELIVRGISGEFFIFSDTKYTKKFEERLQKIKDFVENYKGFPVKVKIYIASVFLPENSSLIPEEIRKIISVVKQKAKERRDFYIAKTEEVEREIIPSVSMKFKDISFISNAISEEKIEIYFQPIVNLKIGDVYGYEALARLEKNGDVIPAGAFIELINRLDLGVDLDRVVLKRVSEHADILKKVAKNLFVNVNAKSLKSESYIESLSEVKDHLKRNRINLIMELTEHALLENVEVVRFLSEEFGIRFAVDDFGTGYSSLKTVIDLADSGLIEVLKIDGELVRGITTSEKNRKIVKMIASMSKNLNTKTVAEFVENPEITALIREMGINYGQGYALGKPQPIDQLLS